jgi:hypothetical protein
MEATLCPRISWTAGEPVSNRELAKTLAILHREFTAFPHLRSRAEREPPSGLGSRSLAPRTRQNLLFEGS